MGSNSDSESSSSSSLSTESTPPKVPEVNEAKSNSDKAKKAIDHQQQQSSSAKVDDNGDPVKAFQEDMQMEGYTVEDHFAKALGDTWIKLQKAEEEKRSKNKSEEKPTLVASS